MKISINKMINGVSIDSMIDTIDKEMVDKSKGRMFSVYYDDCGNNKMQIQEIFENIGAKNYIIAESKNVVYFNSEMYNEYCYLCFIRFDESIVLDSKKLAVIYNKNNKIPLITKIDDPVYIFVYWLIDLDPQCIVKNFDIDAVKELYEMRGNFIDITLFYIDLLNKNMLNIDDVSDQSEFLYCFKYRIMQMDYFQLKVELDVFYNSYIPRDCYWVKLKEFKCLPEYLKMYLTSDIYVKPKYSNEWDDYKNEIAVVIDNWDIKNSSNNENNKKLIHNLALYSSCHLFNGENKKKYVKPVYNYLFVTSFLSLEECLMNSDGEIPSYPMMNFKQIDFEELGSLTFRKHSKKSINKYLTNKKL